MECYILYSCIHALPRQSQGAQKIEILSWFSNIKIFRQNKNIKFGEPRSDTWMEHDTECILLLRKFVNRTIFQITETQLECGIVIVNLICLKTWQQALLCIGKTLLLICRILVQIMTLIQVCLKEIILDGKKSGCWGHEKQERGGGGRRRCQSGR